MITELKEINKPFVVLLNCMYPQSTAAQELAGQLQERYGVPVLAVSCLDLTEADIKQILTNVLYEFPVKEISVEMPRWVVSLKKDH